jgi:hypothetical protein
MAIEQARDITELLVQKTKCSFFGQIAAEISICMPI